MKKLLTLLATLAIAVSLSMPVFAQETQGSQAEAAPQSAPAKKHSKKKKKHAAKKKTSKKASKKKKKETKEGEGQ